VLKTIEKDWGPKSFKFMNFWLQDQQFHDVVKKTWEEVQISRWSAFVFKEKLKILKKAIKEWSKEAYGGIQQKIVAIT